jgi:SP family sugar:H+ symporter-like MFS transporter
LHRLWNFLLAFFTPFITSAIDFRYGYVFAACNLLGGLIVYFFVMEGQGRTLEELDTMYIERVIPWKSKNWVAPPPEEISRIRKEAGTHDDVETGVTTNTNGTNGTNGANGTHGTNGANGLNGVNGTR